jgi:thiamine pyrophosphokinase
VEQLLEWSPTVVVLDGALERVISLGIKVDVWLGDFDHAQAADYSDYPLKKIHTPDQNLTDLEKAFEYLIAEGYPAVNVVWASGKRMDHTLNNFHSLVRYGRKLKIVFFDDYSTSYLLPANFEKWYPAGTPISLIPYGEAFQVKSSGLVYDLNHPVLKLGTQTSSSNEVREDGIVKISYEDGALILMECHD